MLEKNVGLINDTSLDWSDIQKIWLTPGNCPNEADLDPVPIGCKVPTHSTPNSLEQVKVDLRDILEDAATLATTDQSNLQTNVAGNSNHDISFIDNSSEYEIDPFIWFANAGTDEGFLAIPPSKTSPTQHPSTVLAVPATTAPADHVTPAAIAVPATPTPADHVTPAVITVSDTDKTILSDVYTDPNTVFAAVPSDLTFSDTTFAAVPAVSAIPTFHETVLTALPTKPTRPATPAVTANSTVSAAPIISDTDAIVAAVSAVSAVHSVTDTVFVAAPTATAPTALATIFPHFSTQPFSTTTTAVTFPAKVQPGTSTLWQPFLPLPASSNTSAVTIPAAVKSVTPTLWQPFLPLPAISDTIQPLSTSSLPLLDQPVSPIIPHQSNLPLPPNQWVDKNEKKISPKDIPFGVLLESIPHDRVNFSPDNSNQINNRGKKKQRNKIDKREHDQVNTEVQIKERKKTTKGVEKNHQHALVMPKKANIENIKGKQPCSNKIRKPSVISKKSRKENQNKTYESHPNMSRIRKQGKKYRDDLSYIDSYSDWETDNSSIYLGNKKNKAIGPRKVEIIKEKTVCKDRGQVTHSSEIKKKSKQQEENTNELGNDGPLRMAPDPTEINIVKENQHESPLRPQRHWEPECDRNSQIQNSVVNNWPNQHQERNMGYNRSPLPYDRPPPNRNSDYNQVTPPQKQKCVEKRSYHISSIGEDGEEIREESSICEDGFQIYHSSAYKKKMKRLEKLKQKKQ